MTDSDSRSDGTMEEPAGGSSGSVNSKGSGGTEAAAGGSRASDGGNAGTGASPVTSGGTPNTGGALTAGGTGGAGGSAGAPAPQACRNPARQLIEGQETGFVSCQGNAVHRAEQRDCPTQVPRAEACALPAACAEGAPCSAECEFDADCTQLPGGHCQLLPASPGFGASCLCLNGCVTDEDCVERSELSGIPHICECDDPIGRCVPASCTTDADCDEGLCLATSPEGCSPRTFACQTEEDQCLQDSDCLGGVCVTEFEGGHSCQGIQGCPVPGRPFLVGGLPRVAAVACRSDWSSELTPDLAGLDARERTRLGEHWLEVALMEHASIAAFARFALDLLALGAPPELVTAAHEAMADETTHARDAFALASGYLGRAVGPGTLDLGPAEERSVREIVRTTLLEGCVGETMAAAEAMEALAAATDPAVRTALERVAGDETRHAALAWRFIAWALGSDDHELASATASQLQARGFAGCAPAGSTAAAPSAPGLAAHGLLDEQTRLEIGRTAIELVVSPCARALLRSMRPSRAEATTLEAPGVPAA